MLERAVSKFADWFGSARCVLQTLCVCMALVAAEAAWPSVDPHNLRYLYALTVYSSVTQPALAFAADRLLQRLLELLAEVRAATTLLVQLARNEEQVQAALVAQGQAIQAALAQITGRDTPPT